MSSRFNIDPPSPRNYSRTGTTHIIAGWYANAEGQPARAIRILIGKNTVSCCAIARPDVQNKFQDVVAMSNMVGFRAAFKTGQGIKWLKIQIMDETGTWGTIASRLVWAKSRQKTNASIATRYSITTSTDTTASHAASFRSGLDGLWQSCRSVKLSYTQEPCPITWVIPDFSEGGGGHLNIFRMIKNLEDLGAPPQQVLIVGHHSKKDRFEAEIGARKYFFTTKARIYLPTDPLPCTEVMIATGWQTAYFVKEQSEALRKFYFVQDFEPLFYAAGSNALLAANTYRFGFKTITAGSWLESLLSRDYGAQAVSYGFSYDRHLYSPPPSPPDQFKYDIFFYARPFTERRMFDLGVAAIQSAIESAGRPLKIAFAGSNLPPDCTPFPYTNLGVLSLEQLSMLYGNIRCALVLSATNASLLPYELMACGCPVVTNQGDNNEWLFPDGYGGVAANTPEDLGGLITKVIVQPELRRSLSAQGLQIVSTTDWISGAKTVLKFLEKEGA